MTRPTIQRAVANANITADMWNDNFDAIMDYADDAVAESKEYVDGYMPSQTGQSGKFLTTNGTSASWQEAIQTGQINWFAFETIPTGYLVCDGSAVSRTTYSALFNKIGTAFGEGDGSTTFNIPDLIDRVMWGNNEVGTYLEAGLPDHTHNIDGMPNFNNMPRGDDRGNCVTYSKTGVTRNASETNPIYGNSDTVQPPAVTLLPCIKY